MAAQLRTTDREIARLARRAHGVVTHAELRAAGISRHEIQRRLDSGALIPAFRGVYRVGHRAPSVEATYMAAVKACGNRPVLSGLAAAYHQGLIRRPPSLPEVTAPTERKVEGIKTRHCRRLDRRDVTTRNRIPITTAPRTLVDIAPDLSDEELAEACHQAGFRHKTTPRHIKRVLDRRPNAPGAGKLKRIMSGETKVSLSALERRFLARLKEADLPLPDQTNKPAGTKRVDCRWTRQKLTVELDSYTFHNSRYSWDRDRQREREAYARGDQFRRYSWDDVFNHPAQMLEELEQLLAGR